MAKHINSRAKGKRIERELVAFLKLLGFDDARRTQQYNGAGAVGDVECPDSLPHVHFECKGVVGMDLGTKLLDDACKQAGDDALLGRRWVVMWKPPRKSWRMTFEWNGRITLSDPHDIRFWLRRGVTCVMDLRKEMTITKLESEAGHE